MCQFDPYDTDSNAFYCAEHRVARKLHICGECGRNIAKGERYRYVSAKSDGRVWTAKTCAHCDVPRQWLETNCNGYIYSSVIEDFGEHAEADVLMLRIVVGARRRWKAFADPSTLLPIPVYPGNMN
jgi:hypothetical protein